MPFLLKTEPGVYSFSDLKRDRETIWDGVTNPQAVKNLREMKPGETTRSLSHGRRAHGGRHGHGGQRRCQRS